MHAHVSDFTWFVLFAKQALCLLLVLSCAARADGFFFRLGSQPSSESMGSNDAQKPQSFGWSFSWSSNANVNSESSNADTNSNTNTNAPSLARVFQNWFHQNSPVHAAAEPTEVGATSASVATAAAQSAPSEQNDQTPESPFTILRGWLSQAQQMAATRLAAMRREAMAQQRERAAAHQSQSLGCPRACMRDTEKLCPDAESFTDRAVCLAAQKSNLSPACAAFLSDKPMVRTSRLCTNYVCLCD